MHHNNNNTHHNNNNKILGKNNLILKRKSHILNIQTSLTKFLRFQLLMILNNF